MKKAILYSTLCLALYGVSAQGSVTFVGNDIVTASAWRTPAVTKANDVDGDNVYGSAGYFLPSAQQFGYRNPLLSGTNVITTDPKGIVALPGYISSLQFADAEPGSSWGGEFSDCGTLDVVPGSLGLTGAGIMPSLAGTSALNLTLKRTSSPAFRLTLIFGNNPNPLTFFETSAINENTTVTGNAGIPNSDDPLGMNVTINDGSGAVSQLSGDATLATNTVGYTTYQSWDIPAGSSDISITIDLAGTTTTVPRLSGVAFDSLPVTAPTILIPVSGGGIYFNGNPVGLTVTAGGTGIGYRWLKNSISVAGATNWGYTILNAATNDSGNYQVVITNSAGSITSAVAVVTVLAPPVTVLLQDTFSNGVAGNIDGRTPDTVGTSNWIAGATWITDGTQATGTGTSGQTGNALLPFVPQPGRIYTLSADIEDTDATDPGSWAALGFCNGVNVASAWHTVNNPVGWMLARGDNLAANQAFIGPGTANGSGTFVPTNVTTYKIILDTTASSPANWTFTYLENGVVWRPTTVFGGSGPAITRVGLGKVASAVAHVHNFVLSQQVPFSSPFFTTQPVGGTNFVGETKSFNVNVGGSDPLSYQWQKNSNNIPSATNSVLTLTNVQTSDSGSYRVVVTNPLGSTNSTGASVQVVVPVVGTIYQDAFSYVTTNLNGQLPDSIGGLAWIASTVLSGDTVNNVWSSDGTKVIAFTAASANAFLPFVPEAGKVYTLSATIDCQGGSWLALGFANGKNTDIDWQGANNPVGWSLSRPDGTAQINQVFIGTGTAGGTSTGFSPNEPHNYAVILDTRPASKSAWTITFLMDSNILVGPLAFGGTGPTISTVGLGSYQSSYSTVQNFSLTVAAASATAPVVLTQPASGTFLVGSQISLSVYAGGSTPFTYQWQKNSNNIAGANLAQLTLPNLSTTDSGYYRLVVSNAVSSVTSSNALISVVTSLPIVITNFDAGDVLPGITVTTNNDLVITELASVSPAASGNNFTGLNMRNGTTGTALENSTANPANVMNSGTYDFTFDTSVNTSGYDIGSVVTYSGWSDRAGQDHTVYYRQVGNTNFVFLANVRNTSPGSGSLREAITNFPSGILASSVNAIRVVVNTTFYVYREIEVDGTPTVAVAVPTLGIKLQGGTVILSWPTSATGYSLSSSPTLGTGAVWQPAGGAPIVVTGLNQVTIPATNQTQFFRLVK